MPCLWFRETLSEPVTLGGRFTLRLRALPVALTSVLLIAALALFVAFFPYISGVTASKAWLDSMKWFQGWLYY